MKRSSWLVPMLAVVVTMPATAAVEQDRFVVSGAGARVAQGNLELEVLMGDIAVGPSADVTFELWHGFWAPLPLPSVSVPPSPAVSVTHLGQPAPNPGRGSIVLYFGLARTEHVTLAVHDLAGRRVRTLVSARLEEGDHWTTWDLGAADGHRVPSGLYFVRLEVVGLQASRKVVVP